MYRFYVQSTEFLYTYENVKWGQKSTIKDARFVLAEICASPKVICLTFHSCNRSSSPTKKDAFLLFDALLGGGGGDGAKN